MERAGGATVGPRLRRRGAGDTSSERTINEEDLVEWSEEEWTTRDGEPGIRGEETARHLPKETWEQLKPAQHRATNAK